MNFVIANGYKRQLNSCLSYNESYYTVYTYWLHELLDQQNRMAQLFMARSLFMQPTKDLLCFIPDGPCHNFLLQGNFMAKWIEYLRLFIYIHDKFISGG